MPAITATSMSGAGSRVLVLTTLNGTDSLTYEIGDILTLRNPTGSSISPTIDGAGGTTWPAPGVGTVSVSAGLPLGAIAAGTGIVVRMDSISAYLQGVIAITSGSGLIGSILRN